MTRLSQHHRQRLIHIAEMAPPSQATLNIRSLRNLVDQEISKGIKYVKQSAATRMSLPDTITSMVLGLDVQNLALYSSEEVIPPMIELAKTTPVLLTYTAGQERQQALQAIWQLQTRANNAANPIARFLHDQPTHTQTHFLTSRVKEMPLGPRGYARIDYIPCDVVPLVDYWPDFVRKAFALQCWRFAIDDAAKGCDGAVVVLEIMEGRLDLIEWLIEMEDKREMAVRRDSVAAGPRDRTRGGIWPIPSTVVGDGQGCEEERSEGGVVMEAARMMDVLKI